MISFCIILFFYVMIDDMKKDVPNIGFIKCRENAREIDNDAVLRSILGHIRIHYKHCLVKGLYRK